MRPVNEHMWPNSKAHFEEAHCVLRAARETTMQSAAYRHTNSLASQVLSEVKSVHDNILQEIETRTS